MMELEEWQKAWLAAAIDGEGTISIAWQKRKNGTKNPYAYIGVTNAYKEFVDRVKEFCDVDFGGVYESSGVNFKSYRFTTRRINIIEKVLKQIRPFLIVKAKNADIVLDFIEKKKLNYDVVPMKTESLKPNKYVGVNNMKKGFRGNSEQHRLNALGNGMSNNHLKGNRGNSEQHRLNALGNGMSNNHLKGNRGNFEQHSYAGSRRGKGIEFQESNEQKQKQSNNKNN